MQHRLRLRVIWRIGYFKTVDGYPRIVPTSSATAAMICMDATYQLWSAQQRYGSRLHEPDHWISSLRITTYLSSLKSFLAFLESFLNLSLHSKTACLQSTSHLPEPWSTNLGSRFSFPSPGSDPGSRLLPQYNVFSILFFLPDATPQCRYLIFNCGVLGEMMK